MVIVATQRKMMRQKTSACMNTSQSQLTCTEEGFGTVVTTVVPICANFLTGATATFLINCELEFWKRERGERIVISINNFKSISAAEKH